jgi:hypothetical protein
MERELENNETKKKVKVQILVGNQYMQDEIVMLRGLDPDDDDNLPLPLPLFDHSIVLLILL